MAKHDRFIVFLSFCFIILALTGRYLFPHTKPILNLMSEEESWRIDQLKALEIINNHKEVQAFLDQGRTRKEDKDGIVISQPKLTLQKEPSENSPYWEFQVFEEVLEIPKEGSPSSHTATFNWYQVNANDGQVRAVFAY